MNNGNFSYLKNDLRYLGFGDEIFFNEELEKQIAQQVSEFQLKTEACFDHWSRMEAKLYFRKGDKAETYFFTKYDATILYYDNPKHNKTQTFYIWKGAGVTFREAFNLLQGRAVYKELTGADGSKYNAWIQLTFGERNPKDTNYKVRQFGANYGYDLEKILRTYPIRELNDESLKHNLIQSLRKGNIHSVTFDKTSKIEKMYVEACPEFKTVTLYSQTSRDTPRPAFPKGEVVKEEASIFLPDSGGSPKEEEVEEDKEPAAKKKGRRQDSL